MPVAVLNSPNALPPPTPGAQTYPRPRVSDPGERAYQLLGPLTRRDPPADWPLLRLIGALGVPDTVPWAFCNTPGAAAFLHPAIAPPEWLEWEAAIVGGRLQPWMSVSEQRAEVLAPSGRERGATARMILAAAPHMRAPRRHRVRERWRASHPDEVSPPYLQIRLRGADVIDATKAERAIRAAKPAGLVVDVVISDDTSWIDVGTTYPTWTAAAAAKATWVELSTED